MPSTADIADRVQRTSCHHSDDVRYLGHRCRRNAEKAGIKLMHPEPTSRRPSEGSIASDSGHWLPDKGRSRLVILTYEA